MNCHTLKFPSPVRVVTLALAALAALVGPATAQGPEHPSKLQYPAFRYVPPKAASYRVKLSNGMVAYLVPDRSTPLVNVAVLMRLGPQLDPVGKEGLAAMCANLLTRSGTATRSAEQVESRVASLGATLESGLGGGGGRFMGGGGLPLGGTEGRATVNVLSKDLDEGLALLTESLRGAAFQADRVKLLKDQLLQNMKRRNDESAEIEDREWSALLRGEDHWTNRWTTQASLDAITVDDLKAFQKRYVGPANFILAVSGDFDRASMVRKLEQAFANSPAIKQAMLAIDSAGIGMTVAKSNTLPQLDLKASYGLNGLGETVGLSSDQIARGSYASWSAGFELRVPILGGRKTRHEYELAQLRVQRPRI